MESCGYVEWRVVGMGKRGGDCFLISSVMEKICTQVYHAPCGDLILGSYEGKLCLCLWKDGAHNEFIERRLRRDLNAVVVEEPSGVTKRAVEELSEYFAGKRKEFDLPLLFVGTDFQKKVWEGLCKIPYGETVSYGAQAERLGCPKAVRAVATANGANAIAVFVPCHRVLGSDGSMTGYAGGLDVKRFLLSLEKSA